MTLPGQKIICQSCGQESVAKPLKLYEGFQFKEEILTCAFCGVELSGEETSPSENETLKNLKSGGPPRFCRRCRHYVVNPFVQKCMLDNREVKATDSCGRFSTAPERIEEKKSSPENGRKLEWPFSP